MDHAVAIVEAYLQINGYFTIAEYPVIEALGQHRYSAATDLDVLAMRFPGAGRLVPGQGNALLFEPDPALGVSPGQADMLIGEVKEGRTGLNRAVRNPRVLRTVLMRFGCCTPRHAERTVRELIENGEATTHGGHRVRLVAFGATEDHSQSRPYSTITLGHVIEFIEGHLREHWDVLHHAQFKHLALGLFMVREKARREASGRQ